jgi:predicted NAD/FAD-dependent oxidoreductase
VPFDGAVVVGSADVAFLARQSSKPGRATSADGEAWVAVSTPAFAAAALAAQRASGGGTDAAATALWASAAAALEAAASLRPGALPPPAWLAAQRWGGALQSPALAEPCLFDADARFAACGDWAAGGGGATAAARSGEAAADRIATALGI